MRDGLLISCLNPLISSHWGWLITWCETNYSTPQDSLTPCRGQPPEPGALPLIAGHWNSVLLAFLLCVVDCWDNNTTALHVHTSKQRTWAWCGFSEMFSLNINFRAAKKYWTQSNHFVSLFTSNLWFIHTDLCAAYVCYTFQIKLKCLSFMTVLMPVVSNKMKFTSGLNPVSKLLTVIIKLQDVRYCYCALSGKKNVIARYLRNNFFFLNVIWSTLW